MPKHGFNTSFYRHQIHKEPPEHKLAKKRIRELLHAEGWSTAEESPMGAYLEGLGVRNYVADILATRKQGKEERKVILEVDGLSHESKSRMVKDRIRDTYFLGLGIVTVRYKIEELYGKYKLSDAQVMSKFWNAIRP